VEPNILSQLSFLTFLKGGGGKNIFYNLSKGWGKNIFYNLSKGGEAKIYFTTFKRGVSKHLLPCDKILYVERLQFILFLLKM
jgi:hypothetical protein